MLSRTVIAHTKKNHPFYSTRQNSLSPADIKKRVELVHNRHQIKNVNDIAIQLMTEQNKVIDTIEGFNRPMSAFEYAVNENIITSWAQKLFELEQQKQQ